MLLIDFLSLHSSAYGYIHPRTPDMNGSWGQRYLFSTSHCSLDQMLFKIRHLVKCIWKPMLKAGANFSR